MGFNLVGKGGLALCERDEKSYYDDPASLFRCCTDPSPIVAFDCKPGYCPGSKACDDLMKRSCSSKFLDDEVCKGWCYSHPGQCDTGAFEFCERNPKDQFCACLKSPTVTSPGGSMALPACFDGKCIASGYRTQPMVNPSCPKEICSIAINCIQQSQGECNIDQNQFKIHCGGGDGGKGPDWEKILEFFKKYAAIVLVVLFIFLITLAIIVARATRRRETGTKG
jgi:hypothetical protein